MNGRVCAVFLAVSFMYVIQAYAQQDSAYRVKVEALIGASIPTSNVYRDEDLTKPGLNAAFRVLWQPDRLLSVGIEGGLVHLAQSKEEFIESEFGITKRANSLNAYPLLLHFRMRIWHVDLMLGLGASLMTSRIVAFDDISESSVITSTKMYGLAYQYPLTDRFALGCEFKFYSFSIPELTVASMQLRCAYTLLVW